MAASACSADVVDLDVGAQESPVEPSPTEAPSDPPESDEPEPDSPPAEGGGTTLDFVVSHPDTADNVYTISCVGDTGTLTGEPGADFTGDSMCVALSDPSVQDRLINGLPSDLVCTQVFGSSDVAQVRGALEESPVDTEFRRSNGCGIGDWDRLMVDLLRPANDS